MRKRKIENEKQKKPISSKIANILDVPQKVVSNAPNIAFSGNNEVSILGSQGILEYTDKRVKVSSGSMIIVLCGSCFEIKEMSSNGIVVEGFVKTMEFIC